MDITMRWMGATWNVVGDSITQGNEYATEAKRLLSIGQVNNHGINGTCLASVSDADTESMAYRVKEIDNTADLVTIFGGTNDWGSTKGGKPLGAMGDTDPKTVYGAIDSIITTVLTNNPKAKLAFITPLQRNYIGEGTTRRGWSETTINDQGIYLIEVVDAIMEVCNRYAVPVLDLYRNSGITDLNKQQWLADGLHPNQAGYQLIGKQIASFLHTL